MINIRVADKEVDLPAILEGATMFAVEARMGKYLPSSMEDFYKSVARVIFSPTVTVLLATEGDRVVGGLGVSIHPFLWNQDVKSMDELFFWVHPDAPSTTALRLLRSAQSLAKNEGVGITAFAALLTSPSKIGGVYKKMGLEPVQVSFMGRLP